MSGKILIIAGGEIDVEFAREYLSSLEFGTVICADSGLDFAYHLGLTVHYAIGDFDSVSPEILESYRNGESFGKNRPEFLTYPAEKDATDLQIALEWAVERHPAEILVLGATGRRLDHFLANVNLLVKPLSCGIPAYLVDRYNKIYLIQDRYVIRRETMFGKYISFLPLTNEVKAVYLRGFKYRLAGQTMVLGDSIGISNEMARGQDTGVVEFSEGILIAVESRDSF